MREATALRFCTSSIIGVFTFRLSSNSTTLDFSQYIQCPINIGINTFPCFTSVQSPSDPFATKAIGAIYLLIPNWNPISIKKTGLGRIAFFLLYKSDAFLYTFIFDGCNQFLKGIWTKF